MSGTNPLQTPRAWFGGAHKWAVLLGGRVSRIAGNILVFGPLLQVFYCLSSFLLLCRFEQRAYCVVLVSGFWESVVMHSTLHKATASQHPASGIGVRRLIPCPLHTRGIPAQKPCRRINKVTAMMQPMWSCTAPCTKRQPCNTPPLVWK